MKNIKKISIIGLGGIGCAYASRLYDMDSECINIIAGGKRAERYKKNGFIINQKHYNFNYVSPEEQSQEADLIIVSVKGYNLTEAIRDMKNHVGQNTIILSLLNGVSSEEILANEFGMEKVLYGLCIGIDAVHNKNIVNFSNSGKVFFGEKANKIYTEKVQAVKELFDRAHIPYTIPEDMIRSLWWKFMINVGINQSSAVLKAHYNVFQTMDEAKELMESAMREVIKISEKIGINLNENDINKWYDVLYKLSPEGNASMLEDVESGRTTEVEMFGGTVCKLGEKYGVDTPVNKALFNIIKVMEKKNRSI